MRRKTSTNHSNGFSTRNLRKMLYFIFIQWQYISLTHTTTTYTYPKIHMQNSLLLLFMFMFAWYLCFSELFSLNGKITLAIKSWQNERKVCKYLKYLQYQRKKSRRRQRRRRRRRRIVSKRKYKFVENFENMLYFRKTT